MGGVRSAVKNVWRRSGQRWLSKSPLPRLTIAARITAIALILAVPLNLVIFAVIWHLSESASEAQRASLLYTARSMAAAVDAKLDKYKALAEALARSPALLDEGLVAFETEARRAFASNSDALVMVADNGGRELLNMARRLGKPGPLREPIGLDAQERAFESHETIISDVHIDAGSRQWVVHIEVPIFKAGEPFRTLVAAFKAQSFLSLLNAQQMPKDWLAGIMDGQGRYVARVPGDANLIGQLASESWRKVRNRTGVFEMVSREGDQIVSSNVHSAASHWVIAVAVKKAEMQAASWNAIRWATLLGGGFSILSFLLAGAIARSITWPINQLRQKAAALTAEPLPSMGPIVPPEVKVLWQALRQSAAERDRSEKALRRQADLLDLSHDAILVWKIGGAITYWNRGAERLYGWSAQETIGQNSHELLKTHAPIPIEEVESSIAQQGEWNGKLIHTTRNGQKIVVESRLVRVRYGHEDFALEINRDVTAGIEAQKALRLSEERLRAIVGTAVDAIIVINETGQIQSINPAGERIFGYLSSELAGKNISALMPEPHRSNHGRYLSDYRETAEAKIIGIGREVEGRRKDGTLFAADLSVAEWHAGGERYFTGTIRDITERKRATERLKALSKELTQTLEIMPTGLTRCSRDLRYLAVNQAYAKLFGRPAEAIAGRSIVEVMGAEAFSTIHPYIDRVLAGETVEYEAEIRYDGHLRFIHAAYVPDRDSQGIVQGWVASIHDVTARRRAEEHLRLVMREVNHRSKNLLSLVQAIARQTASTSADDFLARFGERIEALAAGQDLLVKNEWTGVELSELVRSQLAYFADAIGTRIKLAGPPMMVTSSAAQTLGMALHELATNAGKYGALSNAQGMVTIEWSLRQGRDGNQRFAMAWSESGGPPAGRPDRKGFGSTVIDSMIDMAFDCRPLINFESPGFSWRIECKAAKVLNAAGSGRVRDPEDKKPNSPKQKRVLLVEDEALLAIEAASVLSAAGFQIVGPAASVASALKLIDWQGCDTAVLDINLGSETAEPIACKLKDAGIPFLTMSGYARQQQPPVFEGVPFLPKPLQFKRLVSEVERCLSLAEA
jgi:PAS domain S-box-containing protein